MKSYTDLEQSKRLAEILPLESADMFYCYGMDIHTKKWDYDIVPTIIDISNQIDIGDIPCWSLAALLDALPEGVIENYYAPNLQKENGKYSIAYGNEELLCIADNPIDACYEMILKLKELNLL